MSKKNEKVLNEIVQEEKKLIQPIGNIENDANRKLVIISAKRKPENIQ